jgi:hypothetical protein
VSSSSRSTTSNKLEESFVARGKFSDMKGISSEMLNGDSAALNEAARGRLDALNSATSISSSMLYDKEDVDDITIGISKLKDSVKDFFEEVQKRIT